MHTEYGLDTSRWQHQITQAEVDAVIAAGKTFWYIKGTGGDDGNYVDSQFANTIALLRTTSLKRGVYHFSGMQDAVTEANYAVDNAWNNLQPGEVAILDIDTFNTNDPVWAKTFLDTATPRLGFKPLLYMNQYTENSLDWSPVVVGDYGLIIADYAVSPDGAVALKHWPFYFGQQYSSTGSIGNLDPVDLDAIFVNNIDVWDKYGKPQPVVPVAPEPTPEPIVAPVPSLVSVNPPLTPGTAIDVIVKPTPRPVDPPHVVQPVVVETPKTPMNVHVWDVVIRSAKTFVAVYASFVAAGGLNVIHISTPNQLKITSLASMLTALLNIAIKTYQNQ